MQIKKEVIRELSGKRPIKRMGQNFLINKNIIKKIISASNIKKGDFILEIGPGTGILTEEILKTNCKLLAIEKDKKFCELLKEKFKNYNNLKILEKDILEIDTKDLPKNYKVVANIPYYITSVIIRKFLESENQPKKIILTIQKEVAKRICEKPPNMSILSISVNYYAKPKILLKISKNCFWPKPKVDSATIEITPFKKFDKEESDSFFKVVKAGFSSPRKQIINNLSSGLNIDKKYLIDIIKKSNISPNQRAEELNIEDWKKLENNFNL